jgi:hypothetical protein
LLPPWPSLPLPLLPPLPLLTLPLLLLPPLLVLAVILSEAKDLPHRSSHQARSNPSAAKRRGTLYGPLNRAEGPSSYQPGAKPQGNQPAAKKG